MDILNELAQVQYELNNQNVIFALVSCSPQHILKVQQTRPDMNDQRLHNVHTCVRHPRKQLQYNLIHKMQYA